MSDPDETKTVTINVTVNKGNYDALMMAMSEPPPYGPKITSSAMPATGQTSEAAAAPAKDVAESVFIANQLIINLPYMTSEQSLLKHDAAKLVEVHNAYTAANVLLFLWVGALNRALVPPADHEPR